MRIAIFSSRYPYSRAVAGYTCGGSIHVTKQLSEELATLGHEVEVYSSSINRQNTTSEEGGVRINRFATELRIRSVDFSIGYLTKTDFRDFDIAHFNFDMPPGPTISVLSMNVKGVPIVMTYHGDWNLSSSFNERMVSQIAGVPYSRIALSASKRIFCGSEDYIAKSKNLRRFGNKISVIPNGIDLDIMRRQSFEESRRELGISESDHVILFLNHLEHHKGVDILIRATSIIKSEIPDIKVLVCGSGSLEDEMKKLAAILGVEKNIIFMGYVSELNMKLTIMSASDIMILPSRKESFGMNVLEAAALGLPIIVSDAGGLPGLVKEDFNGRLFRSEDYHELARKAVDLILDEGLLSRISENQLEWVKMFGWTEIARQYVREYERACETQ